MTKQRSSWSGEAGFVLRWLSRIIVSPVLSLGVIGLSICGLSAFSRAGDAVLFGSLLLPWISLILVLLALPTVGAVVRRYRLPEQTRRNHALEHGTIHFLRKHYGRRYKLTGRSEERGFRVAGAKTAADIQRAFRELLQHLRAGDHAVVVARGCGSNMVTAQASGVVLMALLSLGIVLFSPSLLMVAAAVLAILAIAMLVRYPLGMWLQRRRFLLVDFEDASILSVDPLQRAELFERHPVHFVRTQIRRRPV